MNLRTMTWVCVAFVALATPLRPEANSTQVGGPCSADRGRYVDCGNGTVRDVVTGLVWLQDTACIFPEWTKAEEEAADVSDGSCGLTDRSSPGDWRLPTRDEWSAMIKTAVSLGCAPSLTNDAGTACFGSGSGSSFMGIDTGLCWASAMSPNDLSPGWYAFLDSGEPCRGGVDGTLRVWLVRGRRR